MADVPFDVAADFLDIVGLPGESGSCLTYVTVTRNDADTLAVLETATNVVALKRKRTGGVFAAGGGEASSEGCSFRLWASYLSDLSAQLKARDRITDADAQVWSITGTSIEGFGGWVICECVRVRE